MSEYGRPRPVGRWGQPHESAACQGGVGSRRVSAGERPRSGLAKFAHLDEGRETPVRQTSCSTWPSSSGVPVVIDSSWFAKTRMERMWFEPGRTNG
jgi:hypothetical protein